MGKTRKRTTLTLLQMLAEQRRSSLFPAGLLVGLVLVASGVVMLLLSVRGMRDVSSNDVLSVQDVTMMVFGCAGIAVGFFLFTTSTLMQLAHELLLLLDDDYNRAYGTEAEGHHEGAIPESSEKGSNLQSASKSDLRKLSTRDLTVGWRLLVMVPIVFGGLLLVLSIGAWQVPSLGNLIFQCGVRLEYLCLGGLVLMMIGAYLMPLGGVVFGRPSKHDRQ